MTVVAVADTGPIIHLSEIGALGLLSLLDGLYLPDSVREELERGGVPENLTSVEFEVVEVDPREFVDLDPGESAALSLAMNRNAILLTDDLDARDHAIEHGVAVHGSIGIVAMGHARGRLGRNEAASLMRALQYETSLFVTDAVVERGIELLDDQ